MSFEQGLSGLNTSSMSLDVIGNNIANASTVGFKSSSAEFADVYANAVYGNTGMQAGIGTQIAAVAQQFNQGNITVSNNPLDVAINGNGFFRLSDNGATTYSRNGQFHLDGNGYLVNNTGQNVMGYTELTIDPVTGQLSSVSTLGNIRIDLNNIAPNATTTLAIGLNLDASSAVIASTFDPADPTTYNYSTPATVYDSQGNSHSLTYYFTKTAANAWTVNATMDGAASGITVALTPNALTFNPDGTLATPAPPATLGIATTGLAPAVNELAVTMDLSGATQMSGNSGVNSISQDGYAQGQLVGVSIGSDGIVFGRYSNNVSRPLQQLLLANFRNPNGLIPLGNNQWAPSYASGSEVLNSPGGGVAGILQSGATEDSNVDLTNELVNMIVAQRQYQANAQTIKTQDQVLQTLVNLR